MMDNRQRRASELFPQFEIQFTDLADSAVKAGGQDAFSKRWREVVMRVAEQLRAQGLAAAGDLGNNRVNAVSGRAGHEADNEVLPFSHFAGSFHGATLEEITVPEK
jgi:hypothetical protein